MEKLTSIFFMIALSSQIAESTVIRQAVCSPYTLARCTTSYTQFQINYFSNAAVRMEHLSIYCHNLADEEMECIDRTLEECNKTDKVTYQKHGRLYSDVRFAISEICGNLDLINASKSCLSLHHPVVLSCSLAHYGRFSSRLSALALHPERLESQQKAVECEYKINIVDCYSPYAECGRDVKLFFDSLVTGLVPPYCNASLNSNGNGTGVGFNDSMSVLVNDTTFPPTGKTVLRSSTGSFGESETPTTSSQPNFELQISTTTIEPIYNSTEAKAPKSESTPKDLTGEFGEPEYGGSSTTTPPVSMTFQIITGPDRDSEPLGNTQSDEEMNQTFSSSHIDGKFTGDGMIVEDLGDTSPRRGGFRGSNATVSGALAALFGQSSSTVTPSLEADNTTTSSGFSILTRTEGDGYATINGTQEPGMNGTTKEFDVMSEPIQSTTLNLPEEGSLANNDTGIVKLGRSDMNKSQLFPLTINLSEPTSSTESGELFDLTEAESSTTTPAIPSTSPAGVSYNNFFSDLVRWLQIYFGQNEG